MLTLVKKFPKNKCGSSESNVLPLYYRVLNSRDYFFPEIFCKKKTCLISKGPTEYLNVTQKIYTHIEILHDFLPNIRGKSLEFSTMIRTLFTDRPFVRNVS